jgi:hypothetical protein
MCWFMQELMASMSVSAEGQNSARVPSEFCCLRGEGGPSIYKQCRVLRIDVTSQWNRLLIFACRS